MKNLFARRRTDDDDRARWQHLLCLRARLHAARNAGEEVRLRAAVARSLAAGQEA